MKLKEILVQELPKFFGWPDDCIFAAYRDGFVNYYIDDHGLMRPKPFYLTRLAILPDDYIDAIVTREQYEEALAAAQKVEWDGVGMPPVGCECEVAQSGQVVWDTFKVIAIAGDAVFGLLNNVSAVALDVYIWSFRPIRSEADKKRDAAIEVMIEAYFKAPPIDEPNEYDRLAMHQLYDAIAAGKIPGVRIE